MAVVKTSNPTQGIDSLKGGTVSKTKYGDGMIVPKETLKNQIKQGIIQPPSTCAISCKSSCVVYPACSGSGVADMSRVKSIRTLK